MIQLVKLGFGLSTDKVTEKCNDLLPEVARNWIGSFT